jgi:hypothetical protein
VKKNHAHAAILTDIPYRLISTESALSILMLRQQFLAVMISAVVGGSATGMQSLHTANASEVK